MGELCNMNDKIIELKEYKNRQIKHALFLGNSTTFILKYRRFRCLECGKTFSVSVFFTNGFAQG